jgi:3-hydroxybutyryl-CoA dehydratase
VAVDDLRSRYSGELSVGDRLVTRGRTIGETDVTMFSSLTGDWHPQHADAEWAKGSLFGERIAHGLLVLAIGGGLVELDPDRVVALRRLRDVVFKRPVRFGDTVSTEATVEEISAVGDGFDLVRLRWRIRNQRDEVVIHARVDVVWRNGAPE